MMSNTAGLNQSHRAQQHKNSPLGAIDIYSRLFAKLNLAFDQCFALIFFFNLLQSSKSFQTEVFKLLRDVQTFLKMYFFTFFHRLKGSCNLVCLLLKHSPLFISRQVPNHLMINGFLMNRLEKAHPAFIYPLKSSLGTLLKESE